MTTNTDKLVIAWWNTSLSPVRGKRSTSADVELATEVILELIRDLKVDCLALGEVTYDDLCAIKKSIGNKNYAIFDGTLKEGRLQFDTGAIYNTDRLFLADSKSIVIKHGTTSQKLANRLDLIMLDTMDPLHIFISHWPSRLRCSSNDPVRHRLGFALREKFIEIKKDYSVPPNIVFLGDFNDEPFDSALQDQLLATRDRKLVRSRSEYLYNPFWRHLGERDPHVPGKPCGSHAGTCFYALGKETRWRTFDQIIFSSAFLEADGWQLNEEASKILQFSHIATSILNTSLIFDHFPVISEIQKKGVV